VKSAGIANIRDAKGKKKKEHMGTTQVESMERKAQN